MKHKKKLLKSTRTKSGLTKLLNHPQNANLNKKPLKIKSKRTVGRPKALGNANLNVKLDSAELRQLQKVWYDKLKDQGFVDQEILSLQHGVLDRMNNVGCVEASLIAKAYNPEQETYYRRLTNYITHNPCWANGHPDAALFHLIGKHYILGKSYRKIVALAKLEGITTNIWRVHKVVHQLVAKSVVWNKTHPEGLDFEPDLTTLYKIKTS